MNTDNNNIEKPVWLENAEISETMDARAMLQSGQHPLEEVIRRTALLTEGQIFELITPFTPSPLIEKIKNKGFTAFVMAVSESEIHTYFLK